MRTATLKVISAATDVIFATNSISTTENVISITTKVIMTTEDLIIATLKVISSRLGAKVLGTSVLWYSSTDFAVLVGTQYSYF